ncbi:MAG: class I SAM-dependent methyltransferase, partial [Candidatus Omnitrophica bacterium]|nr:class I SAM-dependent methyltransferase [Candidatus Omnitrophota bacterium]
MKAILDEVKLPQGQSKRPFIQALFTRIASRYDWFNRLASCGMDQIWRKTAIRHGGIQPGLRILDVCAGTGDLAILCAKRLQDRGLVIGVDMNPSMLAIAQRKWSPPGIRLHARGRHLAEAGVPHSSSTTAGVSCEGGRSRLIGLAWCQADAQRLPFADETFDRVTIGFSTRNLSDLGLGLKEMTRVLRCGGRLIILETGRPSHFLLRGAYESFLFTIARTIGFLLTGKCWPFTYLARSVQQFLSPAQFV